MPDKPVRTRFAPSPTGPLHIGSLRAALFGWLYAKAHGGQFILRIEDTDKKRFVPGSLDQIINGLRWIGMDYDEGPDVDGPYGPYIQSERLPMYQEKAQWLLDNDKAYKCFCSEERLEEVNKAKREAGEPPGYDRFCRNLSAEEIAAKEAAGESYVVRFKMPLEGMTVVEDVIRGTIEFENDKLQPDPVLVKSDGWPTYALAATVDDHLMVISHVTRGIEWLPSYAFHALIWRAFGWEMPAFAHLPVLLNPNGKGKLSKRTEAFSESGQKILVLVHEYIEAGYLSDAMFNFLANIGWNFGDDQEIFTREEVLERFDLEDVNPANSAFPIEKLDWLNGHYIREMSVENLAAALKPFFERAGLVVDDEKLMMATPLIQTRIKTLAEAVDLAGFIFADPQSFQAPAADDIIQKKMDTAETIRVLEAATEEIENLPAFDHETQHTAMQELAQKLEVKNGQLFGSLRVAITGQRISTPTFETMEILGKAESLRRIRLAIETLQKA